MASVQSVGGIATILQVPPEATLNVNVRLYAKLETGLLVIDPGQQSMVVGPNEESLRNGIEGLREVLTSMLTWGELPSEHRVNHWSGVLQALSEQGVETDPETLMRLPFEMLADRATRERLAQGP
jgi:hypothetical protein